MVAKKSTADIAAHKAPQHAVYYAIVCNNWCEKSSPFAAECVRKRDRDVIVVWWKTRKPIPRDSTRRDAHHLADLACVHLKVRLCLYLLWGNIRLASLAMLC